MGAHYRVYVLQRSAAFPQRPGELTIGPPKVTFDVGRGKPLRRSGTRSTRRRAGHGQPSNPSREPGPAGAVVGLYTIRAWLDRTTADTGDAVTLRIDAVGLGNVQDLRINLPPLTRGANAATRDPG